jgi:hypothetical protein
MNLFYVYRWIGPGAPKGAFLGIVWGYDFPSAYAEAAKRWADQTVIVEGG